MAGMPSGYQGAARAPRCVAHRVLESRAAPKARDAEGGAITRPKGAGYADSNALLLLGQGEREGPDHHRRDGAIVGVDRGLELEGGGALHGELVEAMAELVEER